MGSEALQKVLKTLADPTRMRILFLLDREELAVQELMEVLGMAQSRVSRHLGILREAGLLQDRRDGTFVLYRFTPPRSGEWREAWKLVSRSLGEDATTGRDLAALAGVIEARACRSHSFFDSVGPEWDALRKVWSDDLLRARALARLIPPGLRVADIGTGTGVLALELARAGLRVIAVDHSARMLDAARAKLERDPGLDVDLRLGDASSLPLADGEVEAAFAHMVLQYLTAPVDALREMARVVAPGGSVVVIDFVSHDREWMRQELGVLRLGFSAEEIAGSFVSAGLEEPRIEIQAPTSRTADLPETFIASTERPRQ
jgi:ubiquinone/menaquinone biosynthesis C-methylase UbiE/DNA-binding MarR family transcriptional regulator